MTFLRASLAAAILALTTLSPAPRAEQMTKAQEEAVVSSFQITMQGRDLFGQGRYGEAETLFRQALEINLALPDNHLSIASALHNVAAAVAEQGRLAEAETLARQSMQLRLDHGAVDNALMNSHELLASILADLGQFDAARHHQEQAVALILNGANVDQTYLVENFIKLGYLTASAGEVASGVALLNQLVPMVSDMPQHDVARLLNALGRLSSMSGQPDQAEAYYRQAVARAASLPASPGWSAKDAATVLGNLGTILNTQGRHHEALALFRQADAILQQAGSTGNETRATILDGLGESLRGTGDLPAAWEVQRAALDIRLATLPDPHVKTGITLSNLGLSLLQGGEVDLAVAALQKAVAIQRRTGDRLRLATAAVNLSGALAAQGQTQAAITSADEARAVLSDLLPQAHPDRIRAAFNLAWLHLAAGDSAAAAALAGPALDSFAANVWRLGGDEADGAGQYRDLRRQVLAAVVAEWDTDQDMGRAFRAAQWAQASKAAHVARRVSARLAAGEDALAGQVRAHQEQIDLWQALDRQYLDLLATAPAGDPRLAALARQVATTEAAVRDGADRLARDFPEYAALIRPRVASVAEVQAALRPDEAFLMPVTTPDETYVFAITPEKAGWARSPLTEAQLDQSVRALRATLDPTGVSRAAAPLTPAPMSRSEAPFDAEAAHLLYRHLVAPVANVIGEATVLTVAKEGALSGLPLAVLLREPADLGRAGAGDFAAARWLIRDHALGTAASAAALVAGRARPAGRAPDIALAGFADPDFAGAEGAPTPLPAQMFTRGLADPGELRALPRLPGTRRELTGLARALDVPLAEMAFGADATETAVKGSSRLSRAGIVVFATHGLLAGDLTGLAEPALAFSAPAAPSERDDGLLTASEAARLDLTADWVILSACNTAASDGTPGGAGLSGLASAFLFAGARALLVSHWPVRDDAAERLTQATIAAAAQAPDAAKARHLQAAMLDLMQDGDIPGHAHPATWAPFVVVGD